MVKYLLVFSTQYHGFEASSVSFTSAYIFGLKGLHMVAQAFSLGGIRISNLVPERDTHVRIHPHESICVPFRPKVKLIPVPRLKAWAVMWRPYRPKTILHNKMRLSKDASFKAVVLSTQYSARVGRLHLIARCNLFFQLIEDFLQRLGFDLPVAIEGIVEVVNHIEYERDTTR
jgi:hypothetical protein